MVRTKRLATPEIRSISKVLEDSGRPLLAEVSDGRISGRPWAPPPMIDFLWGAAPRPLGVDIGGARMPLTVKAVKAGGVFESHGVAKAGARQRVGHLRESTLHVPRAQALVFPVSWAGGVCHHGLMC